MYDKTYTTCMALNCAQKFKASLTKWVHAYMCAYIAFHELKSGLSKLRGTVMCMYMYACKYTAGRRQSMHAAAVHDDQSRVHWYVCTHRSSLHATCNNACYYADIKLILKIEHFLHSISTSSMHTPAGCGNNSQI